MRKVTIDPTTRLEGHGKIVIFLNDAGGVQGAYLQIPELRGFEKFCEGRPVEELPSITPRICGVCPGAHHIASAKAADAVLGIEPPPAAKKLRELYLCAHILHSHVAHFFAMAAPDFVVGPGAAPAERNIIGMAQKLGEEAIARVVKHRSYAQAIQSTIAGPATHSVGAYPGGMSKALTPEERDDIKAKAESCIDFADWALGLFDGIVLDNREYLELMRNDSYSLRTHYMGLVDEDGNVSFYDGKLKVIDANGAELACFDASQYLDHVEERVESWTYLKIPYLKRVGWKGFSEDDGNGILRVGPLARLNVTSKMPTPRAQNAYEKYLDVFGRKPVHATLAANWARLVEIMYVSERMLELVEDPEITSPDVRRTCEKRSGEGIGVVEAPRGTLIHHYVGDGNGITRKANMVVATGYNYGAICVSVKKAAQGVIRDGQISEGMLNMVEMALRAYDPCIACSTHCLPEGRTIRFEIRYADGTSRSI